MKRIHIFLVVVVFIAITITTLIIYWSKFNIFVISNNPEDWAAFGSYFSGIVLPIYTAINIVFFVIIMNRIINNDKNTHSEKIEFEEILLITQYRKAALERFIKELDSVVRYPKQKENLESFKTTLNTLEMELIYQIADIEVYFPDIGKWIAIDDLKKSTANLLLSLKKMENNTAEEFVNANTKDLALFCLNRTDSEFSGLFGRDRSDPAAHAKH